MDCPEPVPISMPFAAIVRRIRSLSLSIGQLTFASFMLLLAMIVMTSVASVVSIRHIDATFAELQRLQSLGDVAEEIERGMAPEQQDMIDGVTQRLANYRAGIAHVTALIARRAEQVAALPPLRERFEQAIADVPDRAVARSLFRAQNQIAAALLARDPAGAEQSAHKMT